MTDILFITVSTPAVKQAVDYARRVGSEHPDIRFHIYYLCGENAGTSVNVMALKGDITRSELHIIDLMGADGRVTMAITPDLKMSRAQRIVISRQGPVGHRLGGFDADAGTMDQKDVAAVALFSEYFRRCNQGDIASGMNMLLRDYFGKDYLPEPVPYTTDGDIRIREPSAITTYGILDDYKRSRKDWIEGRRTVALIYSGNNYPSDTTEALTAVADGIREFANVIPIAMDRYGHDDTTEIRALLGGKPDLIVGFIGFRFISGPMGGSSNAAMKFINDMDAPFLRPCFLTRSSHQEWDERVSGFQVMEFMINGFMPELDGGTCIFPIGVNEETEFVSEWNITLSEVRIIPDRLSRLIGKVRGLLRLREISNSEKRVAIVGYNYPPGEDNLFGGSFLDTLSSLTDITETLISEGYTAEPISRDELKSRFLDDGILNDSKWMDRSENMIRYAGGRKHPDAMDEKWGPQPGDVLADSKGYMIPGTVNGNIFIGIQPPRGRRDADSKTYHDPYTPPHHQYLAFYEWIRDVFKADAVVHIGTHGTVEFLPGKENAMSGDCYPDMAVGDIPHFYLYYTGNPSEAMLAKRRTHASLVSYMPPPFIRSGLYGDLADLESLIAEYRESKIADAGRSANVLEIITKKAQEMRLPEDINDLEHELDDMKVSLIPNGFHIFGHGFKDEEAEEFAIQASRFPHGHGKPLEEILAERGIDDPVGTADSLFRTFNRGTIPKGYAGDDEVLRALKAEREVFEDGRQCHEMQGLIGALNGRFTMVKLGGDFQRNPEMIPTGYNMVQFDPNAVPSEAAFSRGKEAAENTIEMYRNDHDGEYPRSVAIVMWGLETSRTQGTTLAQILHFLGFRMRPSRMMGFAGRFEPIPPEELGRPRIDVTVTICGFFRDMFANVVTGLNQLLARLDMMNESDDVSYFAQHTRDNYVKLIEAGYSEEDAHDLSRCRLFGPGEGLYGTGGITDAVNSASWKEETDLSDIFRRNMGHAYSMKYRGKDVPDLMEKNHRNVDVVTQMRDMAERELIDLDHYYEFFGGLCKTVEVSRGSKASMYITDNSGPKLRTMDVKRSIEHGIRTRLLNPKWIDGMLETDYHGTQHINERFENVLGLAATTGAVDSSVFSDMEDVYIRDKEMRGRLRKNNNWALMSMMTRLFEANERGYWDATEEELRILKEAYLESEEDAELETDHKSR